ncbi:uncharacterized protein STEHIDRAFT_122307, partial [Stereum hirsutum FP-91666 SS1]|uniref:uncharacterized protein n=1 Tax=Stereum hirsutum (strain FP-91666) TaxID=721885 RepID=UPI000444A310
MSTAPGPSDFVQSPTHVHPVAIRGDRQVVFAYSCLFNPNLDANNRVVHAMPTTGLEGLGGMNPVRFKSLCLPAVIVLRPPPQAQREMISQVEFLQLDDMPGTGVMTPARFRDHLPHFLDEETFPNLIYLCISRTWNPPSLAEYGIPSLPYDEAQRDRDKVEWNARLVTVLLEMRNTQTWPKARGPVTLEFRVVAS